MAKLSIPFEEFPPEFAAVVRGMRIGRRGRKVYSETSLQAVVHAVGQYLRVLLNAGLPLKLSPEGIGRFIDEIDARGIKAKTCLTYLMSLKAVAKRMDYPAEQMRLIREDLAVYLAGAIHEVPAKHRNLAEKPLTLTCVARLAIKTANAAYASQDHAKRQRLFVRSGLLAALSLLPMRIGDVSRLIVGEDISRDQDGWYLTTKAQKNDFEWSTRLHRSLTPFLDRLIHFGQVGSFGALYGDRLQTPLFTGTKGQAISPQYLSLLFKQQTGHSAHIVRTLAHDALAEAGVNGTETALILCGQKTTAIAKVYEVHAKRIRMNRAQKTLGEIQNKILDDKDEAT